MAYMGYDPERVGWLRDALRRNADTLDTVRCNDPLAISAIARVHACRTSILDVWLPVVSALLRCEALTSPPTLHLDPTDLRDSFWLSIQATGWNVITDPDGTTHTRLTRAQALTLGETLAKGDLSAWVDTPEELDWLREQLQTILDSQVLVAAFATGVGDWAWLFDVVTDEWRLAAPGRQVQIENIIPLLAGAYVAATPLGPAGPALPAGPAAVWTPSIIDVIEPSAAALLIRSLPATAAQLAQWCDQILLRWTTQPVDRTSWADVGVPGPTTADLLFPLLIARSPAAAAFLSAAADHPQIVFATTNDGALVNQLLLTGTDPSVVSPEQAGAIIVPMIRYLRDAEPWMHSGILGGGFDAHDLVGPLIAPWLPFMGARAEDWDWTYADGDNALRWVLKDGTSMDALVIALDERQNQLASTPMMGLDGRINDAALFDLATMFAQFNLAFRDEEINDATANRIWINLTLQTINTVSSLVSARATVPWVSVASTVIPYVANGSEWMATNIGWLPPDEEQAVAVAMPRFGDRMAATAVVAVAAGVAQLVAEGRLDPSATEELHLGDLGDLGEGCAPRVVEERLHDYLQTLKYRTDPAGFNALEAVLTTFMNPAATSQACS